MPKNKSKSNKETTGFPIAPISVVSVVSSVLYFAILALITYISLKSSVERSMYLPLSIVAGALTGFACGFAVSKLIKEKGMFYGGLSGFIHSLICSAVIFILNKGTAGNGIFILVAAMTVMASLGGIAAMNIKKKIRY